MEEDGDAETARSLRQSDVSRGVARAHQQGENAVCQGSRIVFQSRDISDRESNREAPTSRGFKPHAYRRPVLSGGTDPRKHNRPDRL